MDLRVRLAMRAGDVALEELVAAAEDRVAVAEGGQEVLSGQENLPLLRDRLNAEGRRYQSELRNVWSDSFTGKPGAKATSEEQLGSHLAIAILSQEVCLWDNSYPWLVLP